MRKLLFIFLVALQLNTIAQNVITGVVTDGSNSEPLVGATVVIKGTTKGTITDSNGKYSIEAKMGETLVFSFIAMNTENVVITSNVVNVSLIPELTSLDEVVISALGIKRESKSLTVAQQRVDAKTMSEVKDANLVSSLAGKIAGVVVTPPASSTGSARIVIRGNSSFTGNNQPLFVVDGMAIDNSDGSSGVGTNGGLDMGNGAADINPEDIETIDVLKGRTPQHFMVKGC
jgi:hypothetical protein